MPASSWVRRDSSKSICGQWSGCALDDSGSRTGGAHIAAQFGNVVPPRHAHAKVLFLLAGIHSHCVEHPYHCDRDHGRIGEDKSHFVKLAATAPILSESHPARVNRDLRLWSRGIGFIVPSSATRESASARNMIWKSC